MSKPKIFGIMCGAAMCLASIWGGAYGMNLFPLAHWANFPVFATAFAAFIAGATIIVGSMP